MIYLLPLLRGTVLPMNLLKMMAVAVKSTISGRVLGVRAKKRFTVYN